MPELLQYPLKVRHLQSGEGEVCFSKCLSSKPSCRWKHHVIIPGVPYGLDWALLHKSQAVPSMCVLVLDPSEGMFRTSREMMEMLHPFRSSWAVAQNDLYPNVPLPFSTWRFPCSPCLLEPLCCVPELASIDANVLSNLYFIFLSLNFPPPLSSLLCKC